MNSLLDVMQGQLVEVVATLLLALLSFGVTYVITKIAKTQEKLQAEVDNKLLNETIARAGELATRIVSNIEETTAKYIREAVKDGKVDRTELLALGDQAYQELLTQLGHDAVNTLDEGLGDVRAYLQNLISDKVEEIKLRKN